MYITDPVLQESRNCIVTGRAATGIYLILVAEHLSGGEILAPANLCYAGLFPAVYADMKIRFCDVDSLTGNVTLETLKAAFTSSVRAAIIPHMYGQPVREMKEIAEFCHMHNVLLIEDCASAMGAKAEYALGTMGDYTVYSTGYSKTLDLGYGGLVCSSRSLEELEMLEQNLPCLTCKDEETISFFSKLYRTIRNYGTGTPLEQAIYQALPACLKTSFLHCIDKDQKKKVIDAIKQLPQVIKERRTKLQKYKDALIGSSWRLYPYSEGAVPWRMSLFVPEERRGALIQHMLDEKISVSDWYPRVTPIFMDDGQYPGAQWHEKHIVNLPLLIPDVELSRICFVLLNEDKNIEGR